MTIIPGTLTLTVGAPPESDTLVEFWRGGSGMNEAQWTGSINSTVLTATGSPTSVSSGGSENAVSIPSGTYFDKSDGLGPLPSGTDAFTVMMAIKLPAGSTAFTLNWGAASAGQWVSMVINSAGLLALDNFAGFQASQAVIGDDVWSVVSMRFDGIYAALFNGPTKVLEVPYSFDTPDGFVRLGRDWNNDTRAAVVGGIAIWSEARPDAQIAEDVTDFNTLWCGDSSAGSLTSGSFTASASTNGTATVTLPDSGRVWVAMTETSTPLSHGAIKAAPDASAFEQPAGAAALPVSLLTVDTEYWPQFAFTDRLGNTATLVGTSDTTDSSATAPAKFTGFSVTATGVSGQAQVSVTSLPDDGGSAITNIKYKIGSGGSLVPTGQTSTGSFLISSGLTNGVESDIYLLATNSVDDGTLSDAQPVTVYDGSSGDADATVSTRSALLALLASWSGTSNWNSTASGLGLSTSDARVIEVAAGSYSSMTLDYTFPQRVTIRGASASHTTIFSTTDIQGTNIYLDLLRVSAYTNGAVKFNGNTTCGMTRCEVFGKTNATLGDPISLGYGVLVTNGANGVLVEDCYFDGFKFSSVCFSGTNITYRWNIHNKIGSVYHQSSGGSNLLYEYEAMQGNYMPAPGTHGDFFQLRGGHDIVVRKCYGRKTSNTGSIMRGLAIGDGGLDCYNVLLDQNLIASNQSQGAGTTSADVDPGDNRTNVDVTNNTLLFITNDPQTGQFTCSVDNGGSGAGSSTSGNAQTKVDGGSADSGGKVWHSGPNAGARDFSDYDDDYDNRPTLGCPLSHLIPKSASTLHPDTGTVGSYDLIQDILDGTHHGNRHATVATPWEALFNSDEAL